MNVIIRTESGKFVWTTTMSLFGNIETREDPVVSLPKVEVAKIPAAAYELPSEYVTPN